MGNYTCLVGVCILLIANSILEFNRRVWMVVRKYTRLFLLMLNGSANTLMVCRPVRVLLCRMLRGLHQHTHDLICYTIVGVNHDNNFKILHTFIVVVCLEVVKHQVLSADFLLAVKLFVFANK